MKELIVWVIHTPAGTIGLVASIVALCARKGSAVHRKAGICFTISMLVMLTTGFIAAFLKDSTDDMFLSAVVIYTVFTAWLTVHHNKNETGFLEYLALGWIMTVTFAALFINVSGREQGTTDAYLYVASFGVFCALADVRNLHLAGLSAIQRMLRHIWRMGFSLIWAALALTDKIVKIQGSNIKELPEEQLLFIVGFPTIVILIIFLYWFINILFFSRKKFAGFGG